MHVSAHWGAFNTFFGGGKVVLLSAGRFDGEDAVVVAYTGEANAPATQRTSTDECMQISRNEVDRATRLRRMAAVPNLIDTL